MKFYHLTTEEEIRDLIAYHNRYSEYVVVDTETDGLNPRQCKLIDIQISGKTESEAVMFDGSFLPLLRLITKPLIFWNFKFDLKVAYQHGVDLRDKVIYDGMLIDHLVDENREHSLDSHVQELYSDNYKEVFWGKYKNYTEATFEDKLNYSCADIVYTGRVYRHLLRELRDNKIPDSMVEHVHKLARALFDTELQGIGVDLDYTINIGTELKTSIESHQLELRRLGGYHCEVVELELWAKEKEKCWTPTGNKWKTLPKPEFNFGSSDHVKRLLYGALQLPIQYNQKTKKPSADDDALEFLEPLNPLIPELRKLRKYQKMYGAFIEGILAKVENGRVHPNFNVNGTVTGRISHSEPNMGQIPSKDEWSKIRGIFIPNAGYKLVTCDYSQLEVCIAAHFSLDKNLLKIIHEGASKHDITADALGIDRGTAKTINFAAQYQCSPKKISQILGCSQKEGEHVFNKYWETYSGEKAVIDECKGKVDRGEAIINPFGRQRHFPKKFDNHWSKEAAYRQAYSSLIQGTGSDLTSYSFYTVDTLLKSEQLGNALYSVHDELILQSKVTTVSKTQEIVKRVMVDAGKLINLRVPLSVACSDGLDRWTK